MARARNKDVEEAPEMTRAEKEALEDGEEKAKLYAEEQEARADDHELVVASKQFAEGSAAAEENPPVPETQEDDE